MMRSDLSIMVVRGIGKVRRFKASSSLLLASSLFFATFIVFSVFAINEYFAKRRENADLRKQIAALEQGQSRAHQRLYRMRQQVALLEDYIRLLERPSSKISPKTYSEPLSAAGMPVPAEKTPVVPEKSPKAVGLGETRVPVKREKALVPEEQAKAQEGVKQEKAPEPGKPLVSIQNLTFQRKNTRLAVSFRLVKTAENISSLRGYLHMIILDKNVEPPRVRSFPQEVLKDGIPVSYKRGQLFVIKHFRIVRGRFFLGGTTQSPASLRVIVYDKDGLLLLDRELELKNTA